MLSNFSLNAWDVSWYLSSMLIFRAVQLVDLRRMPVSAEISAVISFWNFMRRLSNQYLKRFISFRDKQIFLWDKNKTSLPSVTAQIEMRKLCVNLHPIRHGFKTWLIFESMKLNLFHSSFLLKILEEYFENLSLIFVFLEDVVLGKCTLLRYKQTYRISSRTKEWPFLWLVSKEAGFDD